MDSITHSMDTKLSKLREMVKDREAWCAAGHGVSESDPIERLNNSYYHLKKEGATLNPGQEGSTLMTVY